MAFATASNCIAWRGAIFFKYISIHFIVFVCIINSVAAIWSVCKIYVLHMKCNCKQREENRPVKLIRSNEQQLIPFHYANLSRNTFFIHHRRCALNAYNIYLFIDMHFLVDCNLESKNLYLETEEVCCRFTINCCTTILFITLCVNESTIFSLVVHKETEGTHTHNSMQIIIEIRLTHTE